MSNDKKLPPPPPKVLSHTAYNASSYAWLSVELRIKIIQD